MNGNGQEPKNSDDADRRPTPPIVDELSLLLKMDDVARLLKVSIRSVCRLRSAGDLPQPIEVRGSIRWQRKDIEAWVAAGCPRRENK